MVVAAGKGIPLGNLLDSASPAEVTLIETTLDKAVIPRRRAGHPKRRIERLIYDKAADSDQLRERLKSRGIELVAPHRSNRRKRKTQDGRALRRYKRRWKMERNFSWIGNFRRLVVRYERHIKIYQAFFNIACMLITLRNLAR
jgi:transposase